jgi:hypothetical protein
VKKLFWVLALGSLTSAVVAVSLSRAQEKSRSVQENVR